MEWWDALVNVCVLYCCARVYINVYVCLCARARIRNNFACVTRGATRRRFCIILILRSEIAVRSSQLCVESVRRISRIGVYAAVVRVRSLRGVSVNYVVGYADGDVRLRNTYRLSSSKTAKVE